MPDTTKPGEQRDQDDRNKNRQGSQNQDQGGRDSSPRNPNVLPPSASTQHGSKHSQPEGMGKGGQAQGSDIERGGGQPQGSQEDKTGGRDNQESEGRRQDAGGQRERKMDKDNK